jgi:hypothetical protein
LQQGVDDVEEQGSRVEDEDRRASFVVLGEEDQYEEEDQTSTELNARNDAMDDSILDQSVDIPQRKLRLLAVTINDGEILVVDG